MSVLERVKGVDKKLALAIIGILVGVVGLYAAFREPNAYISFTNINETNVLDVHEELEELNILFQGKDIKEENLNLRIMTLCVENSGQTSIVQNHYDKEDIWGIKGKNGEIIEARLVDSSSDYIRENLSPKLIMEENVVEFRKIIFERGDFFIIEFLLLHKKNKSPEVIPIGKIAGIGEMEVVKSQVGKDEQSFISKLLEGSALVHFVRSISYFAIFCVGFAGVAFLAIGINGLVKVRKRGSRRKRINKLITTGKLKEGDINQKLVDMYVHEGLESLKRSKELLDNKEKLGVEMQRYKRLRKELGKVPGEVGTEPVLLTETGEVYRPSRRRILMKSGVGELVEKDVVRMGRKNNVVVDKKFEKSLNKVLPYLEAVEALDLLLGDKG